MTTINLIFNDNIKVSMLSTSFLFKYSDFFKSFDLSDLEEDIYIICPSNYILNESGTSLFDGKEDLTFMFRLQNNAFINLCLFLDIISYDQPTDNNFSKEFIQYVMNNKITCKQTLCFMNKEIRSINNYINESIDIQIRTCDINFYELYYANDKKYCEYVIKHNRGDIINKQTKETIKNYYPFIHKYDNALTTNIKQRRKYKAYINVISNDLMCACHYTNIQDISDCINLGANVNYEIKMGEFIFTPLLYSIRTTLQNVMYLVEHGANVNYQYFDGTTIINFINESIDIEISKYLLSHSNMINVPNKHGNTYFMRLISSIFYREEKYNRNIGKIEYPNAPYYISILKYIIESNFIIDINTIEPEIGYNILHIAALQNDLELVKYLIAYGADIHTKNMAGKVVFSLCRDEIKQYLLCHPGYYV